MFEYAPRPQRGGLLVFGNTDTPRLEVAGPIDPGILSHQDLGMEKFSGRENRQTDPAVVALRSRHDQRGKRHLGDVEIRKAQLTPEELRRMHHARYERDPVRLDP